MEEKFIETKAENANLALVRARFSNADIDQFLSEISSFL